MNITEAYTSVMENENWKSKVLIYGSLSFASGILSTISKHLDSKNIVLMILIAILYCLITFLISGYFIQTIRNSLQSTENYIPDLKNNVGKFIKVGFKFNAAVTCIMLVLLSVFILVFINKELLTLSVILYLALIIPMLIVLPAITIYFSTNYKFRSVFNCKQAMEMIKVSKGGYAKFIGTLALLQIISAVVIVISAITIVGILLIPFISAFTVFITAQLYGQFYKEAIEKLKKQ